MKREDILNGVQRFAPWFHRIDLGDRIFTKTESIMGEPIDYPRQAWEIIGKCLPADLRGKSVLDVGCNGGFYCVEAKRRGAERVLGVDGQRHHVRQALFVRQVLGLDLEFRRFSVYDLTSKLVGQFDITLALGLVYHLKHLVLALERLFEVTRDLMIVESAIVGPEQAPASSTQFVGPGRERLYPIFYADNPPDAKEQVFNWFLPSTSALEALLRNVGFQDVTLFEVVRDRAVFVCRKPAGLPSQRSVDDYVAEIEFTGPPPPQLCKPSANLNFTFHVTNTGRIEWPVSDPEQHIVRVGAHLLRADEEEVDWDWARAPLPHKVCPGETAEVEFTVEAPDHPGDYIIEFDLVAEHLTWFEDFGSGLPRHHLSVR